MCPGLTRTNAWDSALQRARQALPPRAFRRRIARELARFGEAFEAGMDPLEVGEKTLAGMSENRAVIFTHPEFAEDFDEIHHASLAALPHEAVPEGRLAHRTAAPRGQRAPRPRVARSSLDDLSR